MEGLIVALVVWVTGPVMLLIRLRMEYPGQVRKRVAFRSLLKGPFAFGTLVDERDRLDRQYWGKDQE